MKTRLAVIALCLMMLPGIAHAKKKQFPTQQAKVVSVKVIQDYARDDCLWRVPCPMLTVVIEAPDFRYSLLHALKHHQDPSWLHAGDTVSFQYNEKTLVGIEHEGKWWVFGLTEREPSKSPSPAIP